MPLNPLDNMPEALRRQNFAFDKFSLTSMEANKNGNLNFGGPHLEKATSPVNTSVKQGKVRISTKQKLCITSAQFIESTAYLIFWKSFSCCRCCI